MQENLPVQNPNAYSPLALAFLGDAVYGLLVREHLLCTANRSAGKLHTLSVRSVNAKAQAAAAKAILPLLSEQELAVFKRGRNAHPAHTPKHQTGGDYHYATGLECLFGWLYLQNRQDRLRALFDSILHAEAEAFEQKTTQAADKAAPAARCT